MSIIAHQSDNMTIIAEIRHCIEYSPVSDAEDKKIQYIMLNFVVHVNGRQKSFRHSFELAKQKDVWELPHYEDDDSYTLKNWYEWEKVMETLEAMGYTLEWYNKELPYQSRWVIKEWIQTLTQE